VCYMNQKKPVQAHHQPGERDLARHSDRPPFRGQCSFCGRGGVRVRFGGDFLILCSFHLRKYSSGNLERNEHVWLEISPFMLADVRKRMRAERVKDLQQIITLLIWRGLEYRPPGRMNV